LAYSIGDLVATLRLNDQLTGALNRVGTSLRSVGTNMAMAGAGVTALGAAIGGAMIPAIKSAAEYEKAMTKIRALTIASSQDVQTWSADILKLSGEVGKAPKELADALYFVASSGQVGATGFEILTAAAKMAALGMGETEEIARSLVSAVNAYGKENLSASQAADILTRSVIEGGAQADEYAKVLGRVLPIASALGVGLDEVGAFMATFTRLGVKGSEAAVALRGTLNALAAPGKQASDALAEIGLSGEKLRKALAEQGLVAVLELLMERTKGNVETLDRIIPNIRALTGVLGVAGKQGGEYARILGTIKDSHGQFEKSFGEWKKTTAGQWEQFTAALKAASVELGQALLPAVKEVTPLLRSMAAELGSAAKWFASLDEGTRKWVAGLTLLGGPALIALGGVLFTVGQIATAFGILGPVLIPATVAVTGFLAAFKATRWLMETVPLLQRFATVVVDAAMKVTGLQFILDMWNAHLAKGKDATAGWTEAERGALEQFKLRQKIIGESTQADALFVSMNRFKAETVKQVTEAEKAAAPITDADILRKLKQTSATETLTKAATLYGETVTDPALAARIVALAEAQEKAGKAAEQHADEMARLTDEFSKVNLQDRVADLAEVFAKLGLGKVNIQALREELQKLAAEGAKISDKGLLGVMRGGQIELPEFDIAGLKLPDITAAFKELAGETVVMQRGFNEIAAAGKRAKLPVDDIEHALKSAGASAEQIKVALESTTGVGDALADSLARLPDIIIGAIQGGGKIGEAIGAAIGADLGASLGKSLSKSIGGNLGKIVGGMAGPVGSLLGSLAGKALDALGSAFGIGGDKVIMKVNDMRDSFIEAHGGWLELQKALAEATDEDLLRQLFDAKTVEQYNEAMGKITDTLGLWDESQQALNDAIERYGLTIEELGPKFAQQKLDEMAGGLLRDYELLAASGANMVAVLDKMAPSINDYVQQALRAGQAIPEAMRPVIEQMIEQGLLLDANGEAYASAEEAGITFAQTMSEQFETLIDKIDAMVDAILRLSGIEIPTVTVPVDYEEGEGGRAERGEGAYPEYARGGIVTSPTLAWVGEQGPEAIVPLDRARVAAQVDDELKLLLRQLLARSDTIHIPVSLDGKVAAEAMVRRNRAGLFQLK